MLTTILTHSDTSFQTMLAGMCFDVTLTTDRLGTVAVSAMVTGNSGVGVSLRLSASTIQELVTAFVRQEITDLLYVEVEHYRSSIEANLSTE